MNKLFTCAVLLLSIAITITLAYDFQDEAYNEVLARDWEDLEDDLISLHPRARRDEEAANADKCHKRRPKFCCADESLSAAHEQDKPIKKECYKQVTGKEKPSHGYHFHDPFKCDKEKVEKHRKEMTCVSQCVGQKKDVLDAEGHIKEESLKKQIKEVLSKEEWLTPKIDEMIEKCLEESKKNPRKEEEKDACNGEGLRFGHCFWKELQFSCPADKIKDKKACEKVKERIQNHPDYPFPPPRGSMDDE